MAGQLPWPYLTSKWQKVPKVKLHLCSAWMNNRMPKKTLICHLFTRTVKWCVDSELFLVKMQKMPNFPHTGKLASRLAGRCNRGKAEKFSSPLLSSLSSQFFYQVRPKLILLSRVKISWRAVIMVSSPKIFSEKVETLFWCFFVESCLVIFGPFQLLILSAKLNCSVK